MITKINDYVIEVTTVKDTYALDELETPDGVVEQYRLIQKDTKAKKCIRLMDIEDINQVISDYGYSVSNRTQLGIRYRDPIIVIGKYSDFKKAIFEDKQDYGGSIGFRYEHSKNNRTQV